ncbi:MAG: serine/threonine-protein kinase [Acidimicrobiales bacterium]
MDAESTEGQLRAGQLIADRYLVEALIGRGGMAEVYQARDERLTRPVALKVLRRHYARDPLLRSRFEEEARAAALVSHPNVVAVFDAGEDDTESFIVMELVAGETLFDLIARGPIEPGQVRSIGGQVLDAIGAAHARGVLHRDIKPANVLIDSEGTAKVADFGIAKAIHPSPDGGDPTSMNMVLGTPSYLAPERAQGNPATVRSDLWAVGVLLYEAVTGVRPFEGDSAIAVTLAAQQARYLPVRERRPEIDAGLASVIERAIAPDPQMRFASAPEMADALRDPSGNATLLMAPGAPGLASGGQDTQITAAQQGADPSSIAAMGLGMAGFAADSLTGAPATTALPVSRDDEIVSEPPRRRRRRGAAILAGAAVATLLCGILVLVLLAPGPSGGGKTRHTGTRSPRTTTPPKLSSTPSSTVANATPTSSVLTTSTTEPKAKPTTTTTTTPRSTPTTKPKSKPKPAPTTTSTTTTSTSTSTTTTSTSTSTTTTTTTTTPAAQPPAAMPSSSSPAPPGTIATS